MGRSGNPCSEIRSIDLNAPPNERVKVWEMEEQTRLCACVTTAEIHGDVYVLAVCYNGTIMCCKVEGSELGSGTYLKLGSKTESITSLLVVPPGNSASTGTVSMRAPASHLVLGARTRHQASSNGEVFLIFGLSGGQIAVVSGSLLRSVVDDDLDTIPSQDKYAGSEEVLLCLSPHSEKQVDCLTYHSEKQTIWISSGLCLYKWRFAKSNKPQPMELLHDGFPE